MAMAILVLLLCRQTFVLFDKLFVCRICLCLVVGHCRFRRRLLSLKISNHSVDEVSSDNLPPNQQRLFFFHLITRQVICRFRITPLGA